MGGRLARLLWCDSLPPDTPGPSGRVKLLPCGYPTVFPLPLCSPFPWSRLMVVFLKVLFFGLGLSPFETLSCVVPPICVGKGFLLFVLFYPSFSFSPVTCGPKDSPASLYPSKQADLPLGSLVSITILLIPSPFSQLGFTKF